MVSSKKSNCLRFVIAGLAIVILCIGIVFSTDLLLKKARGKNTEDQVFSSTGGHNTPFGEITVTRGAMLRLEIPREMRLSSIEICLATYARVNSCEVDFSLLKNGVEVYRYVLPSALELKDNKYLRLSDIDMECQPSDTLVLLVTSPDAEPGNAITFWMWKDDESSQLESTFAYNPTTGETSVVSAKADYCLNANRSYYEWLSQNYENNQSNVGIFSGLVVFFFIVIVLNLLPIEAFLKKRSKANETHESI